MPLCTTAAALAYVGIDNPTSLQTTRMDLIRSGLESSLKRFCRWCVVETAGLIYYLPTQGQRHGTQTWNLELDRARGGHDRMQLPQMHVTAISEVRVDLAARGGVTSGHFASDTILVAGDDYFLDPDGPAGASSSGGLLRVHAAWPNLPGTVKVTLTAGFTEAQLATDGEHNILRLGMICECAAHWARRQQMEKLYTTGVGGDLTGTLSGFKMGEFEAKYRDPGTGEGLSGSAGSYAISEELQKLLTDHGYVFEAVGAA